MFKRLFWLVIGAAFGFGISFWLTRTLRSVAARMTPAGVASDVAAAVRSLGRDLRDAVAEGRAGMLETEARIRGELEARPGR